jgi:hypothetical protein
MYRAQVQALPLERTADNNIAASVLLSLELYKRADSLIFLYDAPPSLAMNNL